MVGRGGGGGGSKVLQPKRKERRSEGGRDRNLAPRQLRALGIRDGEQGKVSLPASLLLLLLLSNTASANVSQKPITDTARPQLQSVMKQPLFGCFYTERQ